MKWTQKVNFLDMFEFAWIFCSNLKVSIFYENNLNIKAKWLLVCLKMNWINKNKNLTFFFADTIIKNFYHISCILFYLVFFFNKKAKTNFLFSKLNLIFVFFCKLKLVMIFWFYQWKKIKFLVNFYPSEIEFTSSLFPTSKTHI